jgi:hypothetical protein
MDMGTIFNMISMHRSEALREELREAQLQRSFWKEACGDAMADLKALDPQGWKAWYDLDVEDGSWQHITEQVRARVNELLATRKHLLAVGTCNKGKVTIIASPDAQSGGARAAGCVDELISAL